MAPNLKGYENRFTATTAATAHARGPERRAIPAHRSLGRKTAHQFPQFFAATLCRCASLAERSGEPGRIGDELIALAQRMFRFWHRVRGGTLSRGMFAYHMLFLRHRVETLLRQGAEGSHAETARTMSSAS